jgi:hypothetical protein
MILIHEIRGSFAKGDPGETPLAKRARYERWLIDTRAEAEAALRAQRVPGTRGVDVDAEVEEEAEIKQRSRATIDPEYNAVMAQPNHSNASRPSEILSIKARCWQCVAGDTDDGGTGRITNCANSECSLWSVRPYQDKGSRVARLHSKDADRAPAGVHPYDFSAKARLNPGNIKLAVRGYCLECQGGQTSLETIQQIKECGVSTCALWMVRQGAPKIGPARPFKPPLSGVGKRVEVAGLPKGSPPPKKSIPSPSQR